MSGRHTVFVKGGKAVEACCITPTEKAINNHHDIDATKDGKTCSRCRAIFTMYMPVCPRCGGYNR